MSGMDIIIACLSPWGQDRKDAPGENPKNRRDVLLKPILMRGSRLQEAMECGEESLVSLPMPVECGDRCNKTGLLETYTLVVCCALWRVHTESLTLQDLPASTARLHCLALIINRKVWLTFSLYKYGMQPALKPIPLVYLVFL